MNCTVCDLYLNTVVKKVKRVVTFREGRGQDAEGTYRGFWVEDKFPLLGLGGGYKHVLVMILCSVQFSNLCFLFQ